MNITITPLIEKPFIVGFITESGTRSVTIKQQFQAIHAPACLQLSRNLLSDSYKYFLQESEAFRFKLTQKKVKRLETAKDLLRLAESGEFPNIIFSDKKKFSIRQFVNSQNSRVHLTNRSYENLNHRLATRNQHPPQITDWTTVTADGRPPIVFIEPGFKVNATYYEDSVLEAALKP